MLAVSLAQQERSELTVVSLHECCALAESHDEVLVGWVTKSNEAFQAFLQILFELSHTLSAVSQIITTT